jgi:ATP-dependent helicase/nuclease subunit A
MNDKINRPQLNAEQQAAAFCNENAVVAAGAGSGKTMVLANRFAWLLTEKGYKVDEILTLTFTRKAAAQMFRRIHFLLSGIAEQGNTYQAERARRALDDFIHAKIQTLDSYSTGLVKQCAARYGISPDFRIDPERCLKIANEISLPFLITHRHHPAVEKLYSENRPKDIAHNILAGILFNYCRIDKPMDFFADVKKQFEIICTEWNILCGKFTEILDEIKNDVFQTPELLPDIIPLMDKYKNENIAIPQTSVIRTYFDTLLESTPESLPEKAEADPLQNSLTLILKFLAAINALNLRKGKQSNNPVKENIKQIRSSFGKFSSLAISCMQAGFILSIMSLLKELQNIYLQKKRSEGVLTFNDAASLSRTILLEQEDIRQSEKESFKAIIIDEFQDNNELQKDLLFLLAEKQEKINKCVPPAQDLTAGKLFFVGDEKQSIYLFRGADVSVFRKLKDELKSAELPLKINFRSSPGLIGAFNAIFGGSGFDPEGNSSLHETPSVFAPALSLPLYEACYSPLEAYKKETSVFSLCVLDKSGADSDDDNSADAAGEEDALLSADENEARFTAEKIKKLLQIYQPKDIAILFRSRSPQYLFEKHLRMLDIPYTCEDINDFFYSGLVNDIMSVLRLASHPLDSAAYAETLRSPFAGLSLPGTALCLSIFNETENPVPFNDTVLSFLDESDQKKYRHGQDIYSVICNKAVTENISSLLSELWYNEGFRYETEWNNQISVYRELFDYLFHLAVKADAANQGLASFTDSIRAIRDTGGQLTDIEIPLERPSAVHLMTIHKSKGLEFPVVFLCCCGKRSQADTSSNVFFASDTGITFSPPLPSSCYSIPGIRKNFIWEQSNAENKRKRTAELRRLLYVGMTRAEKELYITGNLDLRDKTETKDFSLKIKNYTEKKCKDNENPIDGDTIFDNDTFFGLLLPSISSYIPQEGRQSGSTFFNIEEIPHYSEEYIKNHETKNAGRTNDQKGLNDYIKKTESFYQQAQVIKTQMLRDNHVTPVSLKRKDDQNNTGGFISGVSLLTNREYSGENSDDVFEKVDSLLERFQKNSGDYTENFNSGSFGTIAHICVEAHLNGEEPVIPSNIAGFLTPSETDQFLEAGGELAFRFIRSPLGQITESSNLRESEFAFRSLIRSHEGKEVFINGVIDLFFEDAEYFHIVDFKTDNCENPAEHTAQMACYYQAVKTLFALPAKKQCRVWLYYLRTGHAAEMTESVKQFNLEERVSVNF